NVWELISLANRHPRVNILQPGCGVGDHCIAVDPWFIVNQNPDTAKIIHQARLVNDYKPHYVVEQVEKAVAGLVNPKIACLGLAFKPDIDDLRESPALDITKTLANNPAYQILAVEPNIEVLPPVLENRNNVLLTDISSALSEADIVIVLVKHKQFLGINQHDAVKKNLIDFVNAAN
ncbi:UDP binding domain-containing protein, partial [Aeromonas dhakensis]|uniref:UDP binding domain-containing protein n=1 Tax=Aeromonas dhakensis TaxID=196024 RepID=UPI003986BC0C